MTPASGEKTIVRSALYPRFLTETGLFSHELVLAPWGPLPKVEGEGRTFAMSIGMGSMLPDDTRVHDFGCRTALAANVHGEAKAEENGTEFERVFYRGAYDILVQDILGIETEKFDIAVTHAPEGDRPEHGHIELRPKDPNLSNKKSGLARAEFIADLYLRLRTPREHICACDEHMSDVLNEIRLPEVQVA